MATKLALPSKIYLSLIKAAEPYVPKKFQPLWNHAAGQKLILILSNIINFILLIIIVFCL